jgi:predicted transcriptional regulator
VKVKEIMQSEAIYAEVPGNRKEVIELMQNQHVNAVLIVKKGTKELAGVISQADLLLHPDEEQIALIMKRDPLQIHPDGAIKELIHLMVEKKLRRIPVTEGKNAVGMVTIDDVIKAISRKNLKTPIKDLVTTKLCVIWDGMPISAVPMIMHFSKTHTLPCIDENGALSGILSEEDIMKETKIISEEKASSMSSHSDKDWSWETSDILLITKKKIKLPNKPVRDIMTKNVITVNEFTSISECANKMCKDSIDQIPVLDARGDLIGMIEDEALMKAFQDSD